MITNTGERSQLRPRFTRRDFIKAASPATVATAALIFGIDLDRLRQPQDYVTLNADGLRNYLKSLPDVNQSLLDWTPFNYWEVVEYANAPTAFSAKQSGTIDDLLKRFYDRNPKADYQEGETKIVGVPVSGGMTIPDAPNNSPNTGLPYTSAEELAGGIKWTMTSMNIGGIPIVIDPTHPFESRPHFSDPSFADPKVFQSDFGPELQFGLTLQFEDVGREVLAFLDATKNNPRYDGVNYAVMQWDGGDPQSGTHWGHIREWRLDSQDSIVAFIQDLRNATAPPFIMMPTKIGNMPIQEFVEAIQQKYFTSIGKPGLDWRSLPPEEITMWLWHAGYIKFLYGWRPWIPLTHQEMFPIPEESAPYFVVMTAVGEYGVGVPARSNNRFPLYGLVPIINGKTGNPTGMTGVVRVAEINADHEVVKAVALTPDGGMVEGRWAEKVNEKGETIPGTRKMEFVINTPQNTGGGECAVGTALHLSQDALAYKFGRRVVKHLRKQPIKSKASSS